MPNVVPNHSQAVFLVRAEDEAYLEDLKRRVVACFEAGATATGARLEYRWDDVAVRAAAGQPGAWPTPFDAT